MFSELFLKGIDTIEIFFTWAVECQAAFKVSTIPALSTIRYIIAAFEAMILSASSHAWNISSYYR